MEQAAQRMSSPLERRIWPRQVGRRCSCNPPIGFPISTHRRGLCQQRFSSTVSLNALDGLEDQSDAFGFLAEAEERDKVFP